MFNSVNSTLQDWRNLENVNQNNLRILNSTLQVNAFYPIQPSLCSANILFSQFTRFGLASSSATSATFSWNSSTKINIRFPDQAINTYAGFSLFSNTIQTIFATISNPPSTITLDTTSGHNYVIAELTILGVGDSYRAQASANILSTTGVLPTTPNKVALFKLVSDGSGGLTTAIDENCIYNYINTGFPSINNPTLNFLDITSVSSFNNDYTTTFLQSQVTAGNITNGHMFWYAEAKDAVDNSFSRIENYYNVGTDGSGNIATHGLMARIRQYNNTGTSINQYLERTPSVNKNHIDILVFDNFDSAIPGNGFALTTGFVPQIVGNYNTLHREPNSIAIVKSSQNGFVVTDAGSLEFIWNAQFDAITGFYHVSITGIKTALSATASNNIGFTLNLLDFGFNSIYKLIGSASPYQTGVTVFGQTPSSNLVENGIVTPASIKVFFPSNVTVSGYGLNFQLAFLCAIIPS